MHGSQGGAQVELAGMSDLVVPERGVQSIGCDSSIEEEDVVLLMGRIVAGLKSAARLEKASAQVGAHRKCR